MGTDSTPYREGRWKRRVRRRFASKESRKGLPKGRCWRERRIMRMLCGVAVIHLVGMVFLAEAGRPLWMWTLCLVQCLLCCAWAGLYESASEWQRAISLAMHGRGAKIDRLLEENSGGLSERDAIDMTGEAADFGSATGVEVAEAFRKEFGGE